MTRDAPRWSPATPEIFASSWSGASAFNRSTSHAPFITALLGSGLRLVANAALVKGRAFVEEKTGVRLDQPKILFEGQVFWRQLKAHGLDSQRLANGNGDILYPKWTREFYGNPAHERDQLEAFCLFLRVTRSRGGLLADLLRQLDWPAFAYAYNGPGYRENAYDDKLRAAYLKFRAEGSA